MRHYLDTEFNGFGGELLSLALVSDEGRSLYLINSDPPPLVDWVAENVWPIIDDCPERGIRVPLNVIGEILAEFFKGGSPTIIADWPDDIRYFCEALITGPGQMVAIPGIHFAVHRVDAYPTELQDAVQHNAWWDAMALRRKLTGQ